MEGTRPYREQHAVQEQLAVHVTASSLDVLSAMSPLGSQTSAEAGTYEIDEQIGHSQPDGFYGPDIGFQDVEQAWRQSQAKAVKRREEAVTK